jgi:hypothetical protein
LLNAVCRCKPNTYQLLDIVTTTGGGHIVSLGFAQVSQLFFRLLPSLLGVRALLLQTLVLLLELLYPGDVLSIDIGCGVPIGR